MVAVVACTFALAACGNRVESIPDPTHTHNYVYSDNYDGTHNGHCSVSNCDKPSIVNQPHDFTNGNCICGAQKSTEPTPQHSHNYQWVDNGDNTHKQHCAVDGCNEPDKNSGNHEYDANGECVCGKVKPTEPHKHLFDKQTAEAQYLKSAATCTQKAIYFYSCKCGDKGTETFKYGELKPHTYTQEKAENLYLKAQATCTQKAIYYKSCAICGNKGAETFTYGEPNGHSFTTYISNNNFTCTQDGTKTAKCDNCAETNTIADKGSAKHTPKIAVKENNIPPTYETEGGYDSVVYCNNCSARLSTEHITVDKLRPFGTDIYSKTLTVNGDKIFATFPNGTEIFRFAGDIIVAESATYYLCTDIYGQNVIPTKIATLKTGNNTFYLVVENGNADPMTYTVTLRVRPIYTVTFDTNGGSIVSSQQIEEGSAVITAPTTSKTGYSFAQWTLNNETIVFPYMVTEDATFKAVFTANEYSVILDVNGGDTLEQSEYQISYDDNFSFTIPTRTGYTFLGWYNDDTAYTSSNGISISKWNDIETTTLKAKWQINQYSVEITKNIETAGQVTGTGFFDFESEITLNATTYLGYEWLGWYDGNILVYDGTDYHFNLGADNVIYTAKYKLKDEMTNFIFTSTTTACSIIGINDNTVQKIVVPDYITYIENGAFQSCYKLIEISLPFTGSGRQKTLNKIYEKHLGWAFGSYADYDRSPIGFQGVTIFGGVEISGSNRKNYYFHFNIPSTLKKVTIKEENIHSEAFQACQMLTDITFCESVKSIDGDAFKGCDGLTAVNYIGGLEGWLSLPFRSPNPASLYLDGMLVTEVNFNGVANISFSAFRNVISLKSIILSNEVTTIGAFAFDGCKNLKTVYYNGTTADWNKISIDSNNAPFTSATCYYYSETEPPLNADETGYDCNYWYYDIDGKTPIIWEYENV